MAWDRISDENGTIRFRNSESACTDQTTHISEPFLELTAEKAVSFEVPEPASEPFAPSNQSEIRSLDPLNGHSFWMTAGLSVLAALIVGGLFSLATIRFFEPGLMAGNPANQKRAETIRASGSFERQSSGTDAVAAENWYAVQSGVFSTSESADMLRLQLIKSGYPAVSVVSDRFHVYAYLTPERKTAERVMNRIRAGGGEAILKEVGTAHAQAHLTLFSRWMAILEPCLLNGEKGCLSRANRDQMLVHHKEFLENNNRNTSLNGQINRIAQIISQSGQADESEMMLYISGQIQDLIAG